MPVAAAVIQELGSVQKRLLEIKAAHPSLREAPAEIKTEADTLYKKAMSLKDDIAADEADDARTNDINGLTDFLNKPQYRIPRGGAANGDDDSRKALLGAGWEVKSGMLWAPTSTGQSVEMYPEQVLFGALPEGNDGVSTDMRNYYKASRVGFAPNYRATYLKYMSLASRMGSENVAMAMLDTDERKALTEGLDTAGGYVVPPDVQAEILVRLPMTAVMRANARVVTTSRDRVSFPRIQPNSTSGSIYTSGFVGDWAGETPAFSDVDPALGLFEIQVKKIRVATKVSNDLLADAVVNFLAFLARDGAVNMALVEDSGFITGVGDALHPSGLSVSGAATVDVEGSTANTISNTISNLGSAPKLINMSYQLPTQYQPRAKWLAHRLTESKIRQLVDAVGRWYWGTGLVGEGYVGQPDMFQGKPILRSDFVAQDGTDANKVLYYGDLEAYIIAQRALITSTILRERFADTDQIGIILWERVGGALWNTDALRIGIV